MQWQGQDNAAYVADWSAASDAKSAAVAAVVTVEKTDAKKKSSDADSVMSVDPWLLDDGKKWSGEWRVVGAVVVWWVVV
jgi:hypothetical protein